MQLLLLSERKIEYELRNFCVHNRGGAICMYT